MASRAPPAPLPACVWPQQRSPAAAPFVCCPNARGAQVEAGMPLAPGAALQPRRLGQVFVLHSRNQEDAQRSERRGEKDPLRWARKRDERKSRGQRTRSCFSVCSEMLQEEGRLQGWALTPGIRDLRPHPMAACPGGSKSAPELQGRDTAAHAAPIPEMEPALHELCSLFILITPITQQMHSKLEQTT